MIGPDCDVTDASQPNTAAKAIPLQPPDQGLGQNVQSLQHEGKLAGLLGAGVGVHPHLGPHPFQIAAGTKRFACSGQNNHAHRIIRAQRMGRVGHFIKHLGRQSIVFVRPVQCQGRNTARVQRDLNCFIVHCASPVPFGPPRPV